MTRPLQGLYAWSFSFFGGTFDPVRYYEEGNQNETGIETDTVTLRVSFPSNRVVQLSADPPFTLANSQSGYVASFRTSKIVRSLQLFNLLGQPVASMQIATGAGSINIPILPPGCYFARLGTEVAKFCVAE
ncbi:MAG: T9SS type A sorting domain-containing protein [Bacteroidota bacterium]|nr:T9SS type A sorting domain-containing protein [Bacteroidota bacterium]